MSSFQQKISDIIDQVLDRTMEKIEDLNATNEGLGIKETGDALADWPDFQNAWEDWNDVS